jgi:hypothetical protein
MHGRPDPHRRRSLGRGAPTRVGCTVVLALGSTWITACDGDGDGSAEKQVATGDSEKKQGGTTRPEPPARSRPVARPIRRGRDAARRLRATVSCEGAPPRAVARLRWRPSRAGRQRVDVTVLRFDPGDFQSSRLLGRTRARLDWKRVAGEAVHRWRVLTRVGRRWVTSRTAAFTGPGCVGADYPAPPEGR